MLRVEPCQGEIATDEIQERKNYRESSNIKLESARVSALSALTGSVPRKTTEGQQRVSALSRIEPKLQDPLLLTLSTQPLVRVSLLKKKRHRTCYTLLLAGLSI